MNNPIQLPKVQFFLSLAADTDFLATSQQIYEVARYCKYPKIIIDFLKLLPKNKVFESRFNFVTKCEELELLISKQSRLSKGVIKNTQG